MTGNVIHVMIPTPFQYRGVALKHVQTVFLPEDMISIVRCHVNKMSLWERMGNVILAMMKQIFISKPSLMTAVNGAPIREICITTIAFLNVSEMPPLEDRITNAIRVIRKRESLSQA